jgi:hypothetical protein
MLPEVMRGPAGAFLTMPPTEDITEAITYTNALLSTQQSLPVAEKPAEAEKKEEAKPEEKKCSVGWNL